MRSRLIILINEEINKANCMISNSAKLDCRTKQDTQFGVSESHGSRDMVRTKSCREKKEKKNERGQNHIASPMGIANKYISSQHMNKKYISSQHMNNKYICSQHMNNKYISSQQLLVNGPNSYRLLFIFTLTPSALWHIHM